MWLHICRTVAVMLPLAASLCAQPAPSWKAGAASAVITPQESIWLAGFAVRTRPSEGVREDLRATAVALEDSAGKRAVMVALDLVAIDRETADEIAKQCLQRYSLTRDRLLLNVSHTHSGPVAGITHMPMYVLTKEQEAAIDRYTQLLIRQTVAAIGTAIGKLEPATLDFHQGLAGVAVNRRRLTNRTWPGPVDHDVPVLAARNARGELIAITMGYACHATALNDYRISNDWPGYARAAVERLHPGATVMFIQNCGADSNPLPRKGEDLARFHGEVLAAAVEQALDAKPLPLTGPLRTAFELVDLRMQKIATRAELIERAKDPNPSLRGPALYLLGVLDREGKLPDRYPYPVAVWQFGSALKFIALGGEVVVDYSLRLKRQYGFENTWVAGYSNDVPGYIPSRRVLEEGGYEGGGALVYFGRPGIFTPEVEETIVSKVEELVGKTR